MMSDKIDPALLQRIKAELQAVCEGDDGIVCGGSGGLRMGMHLRGDRAGLVRMAADCVRLAAAEDGAEADRDAHGLLVKQGEHWATPLRRITRRDTLTPEPREALTPIVEWAIRIIGIPIGLALVALIVLFIWVYLPISAIAGMVTVVRWLAALPG